MKTVATLSFILMLSASSLVGAQSANAQGDHAGHHAAVTASVTTYSTSGIVKKVDVAKGTITFAHEPIPALNWPAMTMNFAVQDKTLLGKTIVGKRATIEFKQQGEDNIVVAVK